LFNASSMAFRLLAPAFWTSRTSGTIVDAEPVQQLEDRSEEEFS
jgi:hypothetical protein